MVVCSCVNGIRGGYYVVDDSVNVAMSGRLYAGVGSPGSTNDG